MGGLVLGAGVVLALWAGPARRGAGETRRSAAILALPHGGAFAELEAQGTEVGAPRTEGREPPPVGAASAPGPRLGQGAPARAFLSEHYGARWPEVQAKIEAWGQVDLDVPYFQRPWEEVEGDFLAGLPMHEETRQGLIQARTRWPEEVTPEFLREEFRFGKRSYEIDASDALAIDALVASKNEDISTLARLYTERIDAHVLDRWATGNYLRAPFTTGGLSDVLGFHSLSTGGHGWAITITLTKQDCPDVMELERQIEVLSEERDRMVFEYLSTKVVR